MVGRLSKDYAAARFACETRVLINLHTIARMFFMVDTWSCPAVFTSSQHIIVNNDLRDCVICECFECIFIFLVLIKVCRQLTSCSQ